MLSSNPIGRHAGVCISRQNVAVCPFCLEQPVGRGIHGKAAYPARVGLLCGQLYQQDPQLIRQAPRKIPRDFGGGVSAVVQQQNDAKRGAIKALAVQTDLMSQRR
jgi:hypothetical protein